MRHALLASILVLAGCTVVETKTVFDARDALLGGNIVDLIGCAGLPSHPPLLVEDDQMIVQWDGTSSGTGTLSIGLPMGITAKLGTPAGSCHFDALVFRDGTVAQIGFNGPGIADAASVCSGLVAECMVHPNQTDLPKGYDAIKFLTSAAAMRSYSSGAAKGGSSSSEIDVAEPAAKPAAAHPAPKAKKP